MSVYNTDVDSKLTTKLQYQHETFVHVRPFVVTIRWQAEQQPATEDDKQFALWYQHLYAAEHSTIHHRKYTPHIA